MEYQYFIIAKERQEYLGVRMFKVNFHLDTVVQVCLAPGEPKRGRSSNFGIYHISKITFLTNYLAMSYAIPTTRLKYEKAFKFVVNALK